MIIVFGSVNLDIMVQVDTLPSVGETVIGADRVISPGGKGANQALAARRMGADVILCGGIGTDDFAEQAVRLLRFDAVDLSRLQLSDHPTGIALISVDRCGENSIVISPGANRMVEAKSLESINAGADDILILQCEVPKAEVLAAVAWATSRGIRVALNLAPAIALTREELQNIDFLIVNETECATLATSLGIATTPSVFVEIVAREFDLTAIVTLGSSGLAAHDRVSSYAMGAFPVSVVDTTAAGDAFVGAFAAAVEAGGAMEESLKIATAAAALTCSKRGAQESLPSRKDVLGFLAGVSTVQ